MYVFVLHKKKAKMQIFRARQDSNLQSSVP